jgi:lauroyl/myristoyl acyltransferase
VLPSAPLVRGAIALGRWLPAPLFRGLGTLGGALGWSFARGRRRTIAENIEHLTDSLPPHKKQSLAKRLFRQLVEDATDLFRLPSLSHEEILGLVRLDGVEHIRALHAEGRGIIVVTPHLGPYELGGAILAVLGFPVHAMVEEIDPDTNGALASYRRATGMELIPRNSGLRQLYRLLKEGKIVLLVADRVIGEGADGLLVPFGDAMRAVPTGPAAFALATGSPIVVGHIVRGSPGAPRYFLHVDPPIEPAGHTRDSLTRLVATRFNTLICQHPDQWYVFQPDWHPRDPGP